MVKYLCILRGRCDGRIMGVSWRQASVAKDSLYPILISLSCIIINKHPIKDFPCMWPSKMLPYHADQINKQKCPQNNVQSNARIVSKYPQRESQLFLFFQSKLKGYRSLYFLYIDERNFQQVNRADNPPFKYYSHSLILFIYSSNKIMNRFSTDSPILNIKKEDISSFIPTAKLQILKKYNPQSSPLRQNKSDLFKYPQNEESIKSPFQKDQFLERDYYNKHNLKSYNQVEQNRNFERPHINYDITRSKHYQNTPKVVKLEDIPTTYEYMSKSWTNPSNQRETMNYLEQIINDLSDRKEFDVTKKYITKLQNPHLKQKLETIVEKLQYLASPKISQFINFRQSLIKLLRNHLRFEKSIELASTERLMKELEKAIVKLTKQTVRQGRNESKEKIKDMKEESKLMNFKLQKETRQLQKALEFEKARIKENYEEIYRKIYEENNKLKKDSQIKENQLKKEKKETEATRIKYQNIFTQISQQFQSIKIEYNKLIDESSKESKRNKNLSEEIQFTKQKLQIEENKNKELELQIMNFTEKNKLLEDEKLKLESVSLKYKEYAEKFLNSTKKYQEDKLDRERFHSQHKTKVDFQNKKYLQQEKYLQNLENNVKNNEEILSKQLQKIQLTQESLIQKVNKLEEINQYIQARTAFSQRQNANILHLENELQKLTQKYQEENRRFAQKEYYYKEISKKYDSLQSSLRKIENQLRVKESQLRAEREQSFKLKQENREYELKHINASAKINQLNQDIEAIILKKTKAEEDLANLERQVNVINEEIIERKEKLFTIRLDSQNQQERLKKLAKQLSSITHQIEQKEKIVQELSKQQEWHRSKKHTLQQEINALSRINSDLFAQKQTLIHEVQTKQKQMSHLKQRKQKMEEQCSRSLLESRKSHDIETKQVESSTNGQLLKQSRIKQAEIQSFEMKINEKAAELQQANMKIKQSSIYCDQLQQKIRHLQQQEEKQLKQIEKRSSQLNDIQILSRNEQVKLQQIIVKNQSLTAQIIQRQASHQRLARQIQQFLQQKQALSAQNIDLQRNIQNTKQNLSEIETLTLQREKNLQQIQQKFFSKNELMKSIQTKLSQLEQSINDFESNSKSQAIHDSKEKEQLLSQIVQLTANKQTLLNEILSLQTVLKESLASLEKEASKLQDQIAFRRALSKSLEQSIQQKYEIIVRLDSEILIKQQEI